MFENLTFNEKGVKTVCEMNGKHSDMLMNIYVKRFEKNETYKLFI